mmetsp:Transcript_22438/g.46093  ORF Transcript_22438/g.46093 Transcript_22438/m.46093 type:complete len:303 (+) Transcript_22438:55-963(+)
MAAAAVDQLGSFGIQRAASNPATRIAIESIKQLTVKALRSSQQMFSIDEQSQIEHISVIEMTCPDEGCEDLETAILVMHDSGVADGLTVSSLRRTIKVRKPLLRVLESDIKVALLETGEVVSGHGTGGAEVTGPCSCCESNAQKQRDGCSCCGWRLPETMCSEPSSRDSDESKRNEAVEETAKREADTDSSSTSEVRTETIDSLMVCPVVKSLQIAGKAWHPSLPASTSTVYDLKESVFLAGGPPVDDQRLLFKGRELESDEASLVAEVGIVPENTEGSGRMAVAPQELYLLRKKMATKAYP